MLPRLRFVVAAIAIAILPMVLLGSGIFPVPHSTATMEIPRADKPIVIGPDAYSEAQYRQDRVVFAYARRANELSRLRELASAPLADWAAAPAGDEPENSGNATEKTIEVPPGGTPADAPSANESKADESRVIDPTAINPAAGEIVATLSLATLAVETPAIPLTETVAEQRALPPQEPAAVVPATTASTITAATVSTTPAPQVYAALNANTGPGEILRSQQPPVGYFAPLPKPKPKVTSKRPARVIRRVVARATVPAQQQKPPFSDFIQWLTGQRAAAQAPPIAAAAATKTAAR